MVVPFPSISFDRRCLLVDGTANIQIGRSAFADLRYDRREGSERIVRSLCRWLYRFHQFHSIAAVYWWTVLQIFRSDVLPSLTLDMIGEKEARELFGHCVDGCTVSINFIRSPLFIGGRYCKYSDRTFCLR